MANDRPRVVITCGRAGVPVAEGILPSHYLGEGYAKAVADAGGLPVLQPAVDGLERELASVALDGADGLLLAGGTDIHPSSYRRAYDKERTQKPDLSRDLLELALVAEARQRDLPILGICRGFQLLNVAYGGTLDQHRPHTNADIVDNEELRIERTDVKVSVGSLLEDVLGADQTSVYCLHHQAIDDIGTGLEVAGRATDGIIESLEDPSAKFVLGVLWHPEQMLDSRDARAVYAAFVAASGERR